MAEVLIAKRAFVTEMNGKRLAVGKGMTVREGHPLLEGREHMFTSGCDFEVADEAEVPETPEIPSEEAPTGLVKRVVSKRAKDKPGTSE
jgi:hypothetical protein